MRNWRGSQGSGLARRLLILAVVLTVAMLGGVAAADVDSDASSLIRIIGLDGNNYIQIGVDPDAEAGIIVSTSPALEVTEIEEIEIFPGEDEEGDVEGFVLLAIHGETEDEVEVSVYVYDATPGLASVAVFVDGELANTFPIAASLDLTTAGSVKDAVAALAGDVGGLEEGLASTTSRATVALILVLIIGFALVMWLESRGSGEQPQTQIEREAG